MENELVIAHKFSANHREQINCSDKCGCFFCLGTFSPSAIEEWTDFQEGIGTTALCPRCGIDSVLGSESGYPITKDGLSKMNEHWF